MFIHFCCTMSQTEKYLIQSSLKSKILNMDRKYAIYFPPPIK